VGSIIRVRILLNHSQVELNDNELNDEEVAKLVVMPQLLEVKLCNNKVNKLETIVLLVSRDLTFRKTSLCSAISTFPGILSLSWKATEKKSGNFFQIWW
jgi:hypothetical protein